MGEPSRAQREAALAAAEVTRRAIRRLDVLEWLFFAIAVGLAVGGGAAVAWLIGEPSGLGFRATWIVASLILFVVPGGIVILQMRRAERGSGPPGRNERVQDDG